MSGLLLTIRVPKWGVREVTDRMSHSCVRYQVYLVNFTLDKVSNKISGPVYTML